MVSGDIGATADERETLQAGQRNLAIIAAWIGGEPLPEGLLWLMLPGDIPSKAQVTALPNDLHSRAALCADPSDAQPEDARAADRDVHA